MTPGGPGAAADLHRVPAGAPGGGEDRQPPRQGEAAGHGYRHGKYSR